MRATATPASESSSAGSVPRSTRQRYRRASRRRRQAAQRHARVGGDGVGAVADRLEVGIQLRPRHGICRARRMRPATAREARRFGRSQAPCTRWRPSPARSMSRCKGSTAARRAAAAAASSASSPAARGRRRRTPRKRVCASGLLCFGTGGGRCRAPRMRSMCRRSASRSSSASSPSKPRGKKRSSPTSFGPRSTCTRLAGMPAAPSRACSRTTAMLSSGAAWQGTVLPKRRGTALPPAAPRRRARALQRRAAARRRRGNRPGPRRRRRPRARSQWRRMWGLRSSRAAAPVPT